MWMRFVLAYVATPCLTLCAFGDDLSDRFGPHLSEASICAFWVLMGLDNGWISQDDADSFDSFSAFVDAGFDPSDAFVFNQYGFEYASSLSGVVSSSSNLFGFAVNEAVLSTSSGERPPDLASYESGGDYDLGGRWFDVFQIHVSGVESNHHFKPWVAAQPLLSATFDVDGPAPVGGFYQSAEVDLPNLDGESPDRVASAAFGWSGESAKSGVSSVQRYSYAPTLGRVGVYDVRSFPLWFVGGFLNGYVTQDDVANWTGVPAPTTWERAAVVGYDGTASTNRAASVSVNVRLRVLDSRNLHGTVWGSP